MSMTTPPPFVFDLILVCLCVACIYASSVWVATMFFGAWIREALKRYFVFETKQEYIVSGIYYRYYCNSHFHDIYFYVMGLVLTSICCDSNIPPSTPKISAPVSPSAKIRTYIGTPKRASTIHSSSQSTESCAFWWSMTHM